MTEMSEQAKAARREYQRRRRAEHREEVNRRRREHYAANKEREAARQAAYWERRAIREAENREPDKRAALLATALRELAAFRRKYQQLDELADIFAAIDAKEEET